MTDIRSFTGEHATLSTSEDEATLLREFQEAREYQKATSDILRVISRSAYDLTSVLLTVVSSAVALCRAEMAVLYRYQDGAYRFAVGYGLSPEYEQLERRQAIPPGPGTVVGRAARDKRTVQIVDAWNDPDYAVKDDARVGEVRCMLGVPLLREGVPIGVIGLARARVEPYTERADRTGFDLRRPGRDRHRERAAVRGTASRARRRRTRTRRGRSGTRRSRSRQPCANPPSSPR